MPNGASGGRGLAWVEGPPPPPRDSLEDDGGEGQSPTPGLKRGHLTRDLPLQPRGSLASQGIRNLECLALGYSEQSINIDHPHVLNTTNIFTRQKCNHFGSVCESL